MIDLIIRMLSKTIDNNLQSGRNYINYIQPAIKLGSNILSHRISLSQAQKLCQSQSQSQNPRYYQTTRYYNKDMVLEVDKKGNCYCFMEPIQFKKFSMNDSLRYVKAIHIPLSVARFEINDCSYKCQSVTVSYETGDYLLVIEFDFNPGDIRKDRNAKQIITKLLANTNDSSINDMQNISSISYKMSVNRSSNLNKCIKILTDTGKTSKRKFN